jgi:hypothetical protein
MTMRGLNPASITRLVPVNPGSAATRQADPSPGQSVSRCGAVARSVAIVDGSDTQRRCAPGLTAL